MPLHLYIEDVEPFLPPLSDQKRARVEAWLPVINLLLDTRYGTRITDERRPLFVATAADAIERRMARPVGFVEQQGIGPATVRYGSRAAITGWFTQEELALLDDTCGLGGGVRTVRMAAPDAIRYENATTVLDQVAESDGYVGSV
ncbi:hypothetical protein [Microbacterium kunmingense]|uniref:hypothetical protein n=1 Tax=Microbacterium kunmingense TaxID=2915939 RepID=UPI003D725679